MKSTGTGMDNGRLRTQKVDAVTNLEMVNGDPFIINGLIDWLTFIVVIIEGVALLS
jgi:hypothetical protein